jgi:DNA-binding MarR family transcriptional regulator
LYDLRRMSQPLLPEFLAERTSCVLYNVGQAVRRLIEAEFARFGLRLRHYAVLKALAEHRTLAQHALGELLQIDPATTAVAVEELETRGLVARRREPANRRRYAITLTAAGRTIVRKCDAALDAVDEQALADLSGAERARFEAALRKLAFGAHLPAEAARLRRMAS